jgi:hypothetical protein
MMLSLLSFFRLIFACMVAAILRQTEETEIIVQIHFSNIMQIPHSIFA